MEIRLNKLISEAGVCSRREADNFIEMERVTVNGKQPHVGQKVTAEDVVLVDGERLNVEKYIRLTPQVRKGTEQIGGGAADRRQPEIGRPSEDEQEQSDQQG